MYRRPHLTALTFLVLMAAIAACKDDDPSVRQNSAPPAGPIDVGATASPTPAPMSEEARAYLTEALDYIEQNALNRDQVDWPAVRQQALRAAASAQATAETYPAIRVVLSKLGDHHSFLQEPAQAQLTARGTGSGIPTGRRLDGNIGYLALPNATGPAPGYVDTAQRLIREVDAEPTCGWVVDLRWNRGGNMWPMLAGLGPILGDGEVGAFDDGRSRSAWSYRDGASYNGSRELARASNVYRVMHADPPVAVLTSRRTASSGEAVVLAFRGRPATRSFGEGTAGVPTGNASKPMSDGAMIALTIARMADRTGRVYDASIEPDERFDAAQVQTDAPLDAAAAWLRGQPGCTGSL